MRSVLVGVLAEDYGDDLRALRCPVVLLWGAEDREVPVVVAEAIAEAVPGGAELTVLPGIGHLVPTEAPLALRAAVERAGSAVR
jgi:pimeloyl-ACP methyl ester carboxylesterase